MKTLTILCLYPDEMNLYGDLGNVLALRKRLEWRGIRCDVRYHHPKDAFPEDPIDIIVGGGGQDSGQNIVNSDLLKNGAKLRRLADQGVPMLVVCGLYQLFGRRFITSQGDEMAGISIFDAETVARGQRLTGNIVITTPFGKLVGYENHSGRTTLAASQKPLGRVVTGNGNNEDSDGEGAVYRNVFGTYLHGAVLPRNPAFADALLRIALERRYGDTVVLPALNDSLALRAAEG